MKKIVIGTVEIEVQKLEPYSYDYGRGEKVLRITVDENTVSFEDLKSVLNGSEDPIQYFEDDKKKCEYVGYNKFTAQYKDGTYKVELHLAGMESQMVLLLASNERITAENARITEDNFALANAVVGLQKENTDIKEENSELSSAVAGLMKENADLKAQVESINVSSNGETNELINTMLGLEG